MRSATKVSGRHFAKQIKAFLSSTLIFMNSSGIQDLGFCLPICNILFSANIISFRFTFLFLQTPSAYIVSQMAICNNIPSKLFTVFCMKSVIFQINLCQHLDMSREICLHWAVGAGTSTCCSCYPRAWSLSGVISFDRNPTVNTTNY